MRLLSLLAAGFVILGTATTSALTVQGDKSEILTIHLVPHSYDAPLFEFIDDFYPWA
jgi:hypothetical protein